MDNYRNNGTRNIHIRNYKRHNKPRRMWRMKKIENEKLDEIKGGETLTGPIINGFVSIIKILYEAGYALGSGIRRISENNLCPLDS